MSSEPEVVELDDEVAEIPLVTLGGRCATVPSPMADLPTGAKFGTLVHAVLETADPFAADLAAELETQIREHSVWWPVDVPRRRAGGGDGADARHPAGPAGRRRDAAADRAAGPDAGDGLRVPAWPAAICAAARRTIRLADVGELLRAHLPNDDPLASYADRLTGSRAGRPVAEGLSDGFGRRGAAASASRYLVVDYKTNWLGDPARPLTAADYARPRLAEAMLHSDYPLQALLYSVVLHRFLRWRQPGYEPSEHLGGVMYLFLRGMCGPDTPVVDGHPAGVFSWQPPAALITALSDLLDAGQGGRMTTVEWRQARRRHRAAADVHRRRGDRVVGCACGAAAHRAGEGAGRDGRAGGGVGGAGAARRIGVRGSAVGRSSRSASTACRGRTSTSGWRRCGPARWPGRRRCCGVDGDLLYLDRYWLEEQQVCDDVLAMVAAQGRRRRRRTSTGCSRRDSRSSAPRRKSRCRKD